MNSIKTIDATKSNIDLSSIESIVNQAVKNHKEGKLDEAIALYLKLIESDSKQPAWIYGNAITLLAKVDRYEEGLSLEKEALSIHQESDEIYRAIGLAYYKKNNLKNCIKFYKKAIAIYDNQPDWLYVALLEKLIESNQLDEGVELGNIALQKYPNCQWLYFFFGRLYEAKGELDLAIENYEKANIESEVNEAKINRLKTIAKETKEFYQTKDREINIEELEKANPLHKHQQLFVLKTYEEDVSGLGIVARRCLELGNTVSDARGVNGKVLIAGRPDICQNFVNRNNYNYLWTTFESSKIPDTWVNSINKYYSEVFVPHSYVKQAFIESGVEVPVSIVPQSYFLRNRTKPIERQTKLKLGVLGVPNHRKNLEKLIQAVIQLNKENVRVELLIHCPWLLDRTQEVWNNYPNVSLTVGVKSDNEIDDWYSSLDAYIYPSSGEGWSFTPRESMSLGIPTIITDIPVHEELIQSGFYLPVSSNEWKPADYEFLEAPCGEWKSYSVEQIKSSIVRLIEEYDYWYELAQTGQKWIHKTYQWKPVKKQLLAQMFPKHILFCPKECLTKSIDAYCDRLSATQPKTKYINSYKYLVYILEKEEIQSIDVNCDLSFKGLEDILNLLEQFEGQKTLTLHGDRSEKCWQAIEEIQKYISVFDNILVGDKKLSKEISQARYINLQYKNINKQSTCFLPLPEKQLLYTLFSDNKAS